MIKEVFNSITSGTKAEKVPVAGSNLENQAGETQGFFGKMFTALQQEGQEVNEQSMQSGDQSEAMNAGEPETKEGREAVKQALINLMNGAETTSSHHEPLKRNLSESPTEVTTEKLEEHSAVRLVVKTADQAETTNKTDIAVAESGLPSDDKATTKNSHGNKLTPPQEAKQEPSPNAVISELPGSEILNKEAVVLTGANKETSGVTLGNRQGTEKGEQAPKIAVEAEVQVSKENIVQDSEKASETSTSNDKVNVEQTVKLPDEGQSAENISSRKDESGLKVLNREVAATSSEKPIVVSRNQTAFTANQISNNETATQNERSSQPFQQMSQQQVSKSELNSQLHVQNEVKAQHANEERSKRYDFVSRNPDGKATNGERLEAAAGSGTSGGKQQGASFSDTPNWFRFQTANQQKTGELNNQQQAFLDEQLKEVSENADDITTDKTQNGMHRLGEMPIQNALIRKSVLPGLTSIMQKATSSGKEISQNWQKHSFELDDGNKIELSTRNSDGVIQLKIASSNHELNKLLQQYGQEIREHLEKECELNIDLQFNDKQEEGLSGFFSDSPSSGNGKSSGITGGNSSSSEPSKAQKPLQQSVRRFGYNQMEWTA